METNYFKNLSLIKCEVEKKNGLNYISWSDAWKEVKNIHPEATYRKIMNVVDNTFLFKSGTGGMVMCEVTINGISHVADLAITDYKNQSIPFEMIKSTDIQNTTQRAFAKAIAMHGIGLYVYRGEDLPEENENRGDEILQEITLCNDLGQLKTYYEELMTLSKSEKQKDFYSGQITKEKKRIEKLNVHTA